MKHLNFLSNLLSLSLGSPCTDVSHDRRLTVGSPSGRYCSGLMRLVFILAILLTVGVGNAWATADHSVNESWNFGTSGNANWSGHSSGYCGGCGSKSSAFNVYKTNISNFSAVNFTNHENVSLTIYVKAGTNGGTNTYTVKLIDSSGNQVSTYSSTQTGKLGSGTNASSAKESSVTFSPTQAFAGYKIEFVAKGFITQTRYVLEYDDKAGGCANQVNITNSSTTSVTHGSFDVDKTGSQDACSALSVVVTPNPDDHYHVATVSATNPATTGTAGAAVDNGDGTYTITYSANAKGNSTISVTFAEDTKYTVTWMKNGSQHTTTQVYSGEKPTFPSNPSSCDATSNTFYGWATSTWENTVDNLAGKTVYTSAGDMPDVTGPVTYHAVFAKETPGSSYELVTSLSGLGNRDAYLGSYISYSGTRYYAGTSASALQNVSTSGTPLALSSTTGLQKVTFTSTGTANQYYIKNSSGNYLYSNTTNANPSFSATTCAWTFSDVDGNGRFKVISSLGTDVHLRAYATSTSAATFKTYGTTTNYGICVFMQSVSYSEYLTTCCTELGSINGSVSWSNAATAVVSWDNLDHVSSWTVKYKTHAAGAYTTWAGDQSTAAGRRSVTITGLTPCTNYDFQIIANPASGYCDKDQTIEDSQTHNWTVTSTGVTNAAASPAIPSTTCSGFSTTISPATGYALPADITVTNASKSWNSSTGALSISSVTGNVSITITPTCVSPVISGDPADANYYIGDSPDALSVSATLASGTLTYLWKVSTNGGSTWSDAAGTNNAATYSGASLSTASVGTLKFKCIVGNSEGGCTVESEEATITVANASYFPNGVTVFIQADSKDYSAWKDDACVKAWFNASGAGGAAQTTYWLFDATDTDAGKKLFAAIVPSTGDLNQVTLQRFQSDCLEEHWYNNNGTLTQASSSGVNTFRSYGSADNNIAWNGSSTTLSLYGNQNSWASSLATFADQGSGVWTATISNYAPDATSKDYKIKTSYNNGWIGNTGSNNNATLSGMIVGSTYNVTATLDVTDHSLVMSKEFVKGTVHFDLQGHGLAISDLENVAAGSKISAPSAPSATGYTFGGWYKEPACTNAWTFASDVVNETMTLYAKWTANVYTITANLTGTSVNTAFPSSFTYTGSTTTDLNRTFSVNTTNYFMPSSVSVTMGGETQTEGSGKDYTYNSSTGAFTFDKIITGNIVITATATAKLQSIAITTQPTTRKYFAGESFSSTGAVVTATMGDGSTKAVTASATWTPSGTLSAGASQTVTATYTEAGIEKTATTTIDVYSVTVNKVNEDGDGVSADGVSAGWTLGTKALAASATSASKYVFKQWEVTGASIGSTSSANTNLSSPTANVVVNAVFYKPRVIKWSVNGNDSYETGDPTTTVAYNGTISDVPTDPSGLACAGTFIAWTDAAHNNGQTAKASDSYYGSALYTDAGDFPNITAATTTFYAVFAEVPDEKNWSMGTIDQLSSGSGYATYDGEHTVTGSDGNSYKYTSSNVMSNSGNQFRGSTYCGRIYNTATLGRITKIELVAGSYVSEMKVYESATSISTSPGSGAITPSVDGSTYTYEFTGKGYFLIIQEGSHAAKANVTVYFGDAPYNYVTECDPNIVAVTYNANSGSTSCTNTTTDKTEDFTVCSSAPTRDYYSFDGWLCSADDEVYAASATIAAAAIDADFTLTAQWTPVPYTITYELDGGTNHGSNPASYNVETSTITLQDPTREHDRFDGWYDNSSFTGDAVTSIPVGSHGNVTLYAKWAERYEIIFDADGTKTTIYRADDEDLSASVAGQGSVPDDPDAPSACSSKVFVGWSESEIDDETDTRPSDLMKSAAGTVDEDKHYYAVWAIVTPTDPPATYAGTGVFEEITSMGDLETGTYYVLYGYDGESTHGALKNAGSGTAGEEAGTNMTVSTSSITNPSTDIVWKLGGTTDAYTLYNQSASKYIEITTDDAKGFALNASATTSYKVTVEDGHGFFFKTNKTGCTRGISIYTSTSFRCYALASAKNLRLFKLPTNTVTAYCTSCCATKVTLSQNSPEHGTIAFGKTTVGTCGDKEVSLTITPAAGYQLSSYEVATGSGKVAAKSVSPAIALNNNSSAAQNITLTFAEDANGAYDVTASFTLMTVTSWAWTMNSAAIPDPLNLYVGQSARLDVAYTPAGVDASKKTYTRNKVDAYINWSGAQQSTYSTISGRASTGDNTTAVTFTHADGPTKTVNVKVLPLPLTHFVDLVHGKAFADVVATIEANALSATKTTPTSDDWTTPNANTCEENHLHLVGWIREDWPALVAYLNGTGDAPTTVAITGAGNDGEGHAYFFAPNASINVQTFNGVTFYAVWAQIE